jgi:hypothetical protein
MRRITVEERRTRLGRRHHLAPTAFASSAAEVAGRLVGLHGTDPASVFLAVFARLPAAETASIERELYDERTLLRMLGMRRTVFVVPTEVAPVINAACTRAIAVQERRRLVQVLEQAGIAPNVGAWLTEVEESTLRALARRGAATAVELAQDEPRLREQLLYAEGKNYEATQSVSTRILSVLAAEGRIVRARPRGTWISSQFRWSVIDAWLPDGLAAVPTETAQAELVRGWLHAFGPGTLADMRWWTGLTAGDIKRALAGVGAVEVELGEGTGYVLPDDVDPEPPVAPWVALLPALDPTVMGWSGRDWFLGDHAPALFDRSGNVGPTVWWNGHVVGGWAQRKTGEIAFELLEDVGAHGVAAVETAAERLGSWMGSIRVTPRFRTPLEKKLTT